MQADELVPMEGEILLHEGLSRQIPFEQIGLEEINLEGQFAMQNQIPIIGEAIFQAGRLIPMVDNGARSAAHVTLNELGKRLLVASRTGNTNEVKVLMAKGAPFTCDWLGTSALHLAAQNGNTETAEILLRAGISRDSRTKVDKTALHLAATEGNTMIVEMLLANGSDVNASDMLRMTPLHWAVDRGHTEVIKVLLDHGANPHVMSKFGKSALMIAIDNENADLVTFIKSIKPMQMQKMDEAAERQMEEATLAATDSLANEMAQVPVVSQQEEVETSATDTSKFFVSEHFLTPKDLMLEENVETNNVNHNIAENPVPNNQTMQYFQEHGITMLPAIEESTLAEAAIQGGGKVVLTEAGKLALGSGVSKKTPGYRILTKLKGGSANSTQKVICTISKHVRVRNPTTPPNETGNAVQISDHVTELKQHLEEARRQKARAELKARVARQQTKHLKEVLGKTQRENEQFRLIIKSLKRKGN